MSQPFLFPDTYDYAESAALGVFNPSLYATGRSSGFPLLLAVLPSALAHPRVVVLFQLLVSLCSWVFLAVIVGRACARVWVRRASMALVLLFGASPTVVMWDPDLLTESLTLSFMATYMACVLLFVRRPSFALVPILGVVALYFGALRDTNVYIIAFTFLPLTGVLFFRDPQNRRILVVAAVVIAATIGANLLSASAGDRAYRSFRGVLPARIVGNPSAVAYFRAHGMPALPDAPAGVFIYNGDPKYDALRAWAIRDGVETYLRYLIQHPDVAVRGAFKNYGPLLAPGPELHRFTPEGLAVTASGAFSAINPRTIDQLAAWTALILGVVTFAGIAGGWRRVWFVPIFGVVAALLTEVVAYNADVGEIERHALPQAVLLRLSLLLLLVFAVDSARWRRPRGADHASHVTSSRRA